MGTPTDNSNTIDYSVDYARIATALESIQATLAAKFDAQRAVSEQIRDLHEQILETQQALFDRASTDTLGIYMRSTRYEGDLARAAMLNALIVSNQLDAVRDEMADPTPMP
jgi:hypothetical protein